MSLFDGLGVPWGWFAGLLVFGLMATSFYTNLPSHAAGVWRWRAISTVGAMVCLVAVIATIAAR